MICLVQFCKMLLSFACCTTTTYAIYSKKQRLFNEILQIKSKIIDNEDKLCFNNSRQKIQRLLTSLKGKKEEVQQENPNLKVRLIN